MVVVDRPMMSLSKQIQKPFRIIKANNFHRIGMYRLYFIISSCPVDMNVSARFGEILPMALQDIKETKLNDGRTERRTV